MGATRRDVGDGQLRWWYEVPVSDLWKAGDGIAGLTVPGISINSAFIHPSINLKVLERECHDENLEQLRR